MAVPTFRTWTAGEVVTAAYMNSNVRDAGNFFVAVPIAKLRQSTVQSIANTTWTPAAFDTSDADSVGGHSNVTNNSRYTCQTGYAGLYQASGAYAKAQSATGQRGIKYSVNGTDMNGSGVFSNGISASGDATPGRTTIWRLNAADYLEMQVWQNTGGALNTDVGVAYIACSLDIRWVAS